MKKVLVIAGSDSGAGAGIQADLRTLTALGVYGTTAITAVTAQNTLGVARVAEIDAETVYEQVTCVLDDIGTDAVKTGMMSSSETITGVARILAQRDIQRLVVDPVMVSASGHRLLKEEAVQALTDQLVPLAEVITPNLDEAAVLAGSTVTTVAEMREAARTIRGMGADWVLIKGGHLAGDPVDVLFDGSQYLELWAPRVQGDFSHGTGCTYASAIAALRARGLSVPEAVKEAKAFLTDAIRHGVRVGRGAGQPRQLYGMVLNTSRETQVHVGR